MALLRSAHLDTMYQELPLPERFQAARDDGFDAVELWSWQGRDLPALRAAADGPASPSAAATGTAPSPSSTPASGGLPGLSGPLLEAARTLGARGVTVHADALDDTGAVILPRPACLPR